MRPPSKIHFAPGTFTSFRPLNTRIVPSERRRIRSGNRTVKRLEIRTPGIEPVSNHTVAW